MIVMEVGDYAEIAILKEAMKNFRFRFWLWHFPGKTDSPAAFSNALQAENFRFCLILGNRAGIKPGGCPIV
jgi:hypothetical protein